MKNIEKLILIILLFSFNGIVVVQAEQDTAGPAKLIMNFTCTSMSNDSILLKAAISVRREEGNTNLMNALVKFSVVTDDATTLIGQVKTSSDGVAKIIVSAKNPYLRNEQGAITFKAGFSGNEKYEATDVESAIKPGKLAISFYEEDSMKYVKVTATQLEKNGIETPLGGQDVIVYVPRMLSLLKIGQITLDSTGVGTSEFPMDIVGDSTGNLTVIAQIEENDLYGNVRSESKINWGIPKHLISPERPSRELWTPVAPLWMIITLIIMLLGVWSHYAYTIVQLFRIKKIAVQQEKEEITT